MAKVSVEDLKTMYAGCLAIYKNRPVYINNVLDQKTFKVFDLTTQRNTNIVVEEHTNIKAPARQLGFVNVGGYVIYMARTPVRRYRVGLNRDNTVFTAPDGFQGILGHDLARNVQSFTGPEIVDTVFGRYPTITEAYDELQKGAGRIIAFDRQFAIDDRGYIFYKQTRVGRVKDIPQSVYDIVFNQDCKHLIILLDNNYEKSASIPQ